MLARMLGYFHFSIQLYPNSESNTLQDSQESLSSRTVNPHFAMER